MTNRGRSNGYIAPGPKQPKKPNRFKENWHSNHHLYEAMSWVVLGIPTLIWWKESILWVALMSLYANFKTAIGAHEGRQARRNTESSDDASV